MKKSAIFIWGLMISIFIFGNPLWAMSITAVPEGSALLASMQDVAVNGNYAYCSVENGFVVIDVSNLAAPALVGQISLDSGMALRLTAAGNYLYVALWNDGVGIYDISNPADPQLVGEIDPGGYIDDICVQENYAYLSDRYGYFYVVDVSVPSSPLLTATRSGFGAAWAVTVVDTIAYLGTSKGLATINVADPDTSILIAVCSTQTRVSDIAIANGIAYLACEGSGLQVIAMPSPDDMYILGEYPITGAAYGIDVTDGVAYLARYDYSSGIENSGLMAFNVSNPEVPELMGIFYDPYGLKVSVRDSVAFVADQTLGLRLVKISHPPDFTLIGQYWMPESYCVTVRENRAYVVGNGFSTIDISDKTNPITLGQIPLEYVGKDIAVVDTMAFVIGYFTYPYYGSGRFDIISIADDHNPYIISSIPLAKAGYCLAIQGNYAYLGGYDSLRVLDISDPRDPQIVCNYPEEFCDYIAVRGDYAYIPHLKVLDISNPLSPQQVGEEFVGASAADIILKGDTAYICAWTGELMMGLIFTFDISNPTDPILLDYEWAGDDASCIALKDNFAIVGSFGGLYYFDISDPTAIVPSGQDAKWNYVPDMAIDGDYGYMALGHKLQIVRFQIDCCDLPGDFNNDGKRNLMDVSAMINFLYRNGPGAPCAAEADANADGKYNLLDIARIINFLYRSGTEPVCGLL
jgi:hypothetical protein